MQKNIKNSPILIEYHYEKLKQHKKFLKLLLAEERSQKKLRDLYNNTPKNKRKKRKSIKKKIKKRSIGRPRMCLDYEVVKEIVRSEGIQSKTQYDKWYLLNRPARIPKHPYRSYKKEWKNWADFLGVKNEFTKRTKGVSTSGNNKYRSYEDAKLFATALRLKSSTDWMEYIKTGMCPADIPHRPDIMYNKKRNKQWISWKNFLGYEIQNTKDIIQNTKPILYIARNPMIPVKNVYVINVIPGGKEALISHIDKLKFKLISAFYVSSSFNHRDLINTLDVYTYSKGDEYVCNNIFDLVGVLQDNLETVQ